jgi:hypothetical protein
MIGPFRAVLQCTMDPRQDRSKLLSSRLTKKIRSIFRLPNRERIRYQADKNRYYTLILAIRPRSDNKNEEMKRIYQLLIATLGVETVSPRSGET